MLRFYTKENDKYLSGNFKFVQRGDPPNKSYAQNSEVWVGFKEIDILKLYEGFHLVLKDKENLKIYFLVMLMFVCVSVSVSWIQWSRENKRMKRMYRHSPCGSEVANPTSIHEDVGLIPGLAR